MEAKARVAYALRRFVRFQIVAAAAIALLLVFYKVWPSLDAALFPVLTDQRVINVEREPGAIRFTIIANKERACRLSSLAWSVVSEDRRQSIEVTNAGGGSAIGRSYVPTGYAVLGPFRAELPSHVTPNARVEGLLLYDCNWGWLVEQILGPVPILPGKAK